MRPRLDGWGIAASARRSRRCLRKRSTSARVQLLLRTWAFACSFPDEQKSEAGSGSCIRVSFLSKSPLSFQAQLRGRWGSAPPATEEKQEEVRASRWRSEWGGADFQTSVGFKVRRSCFQRRAWRKHDSGEHPREDMQSVVAPGESFVRARWPAFGRTRRTFVVYQPTALRLAEEGARRSHPALLTPLAGFPQAGAVFLLLRAPAACASAGPDSTGIPEGAGAPVAPGGAQSHPQDGAGVQQAGGAGATLAGGAGEESQTHQELGGCSPSCQ